MRAWWTYLKLFRSDYAGTVGGSFGGGVRPNQRISLQKPRLGVLHVWHLGYGGAFPRATVLRLQAFPQDTFLRFLIFLNHILMVRLGEEEVLGRDEEGGDGCDAVLELFERVYAVAKAVLDADVGSWQVSCEVHVETFDGLVYYWVASARMGGLETERLFIISLFLSDFYVNFGGFF